MFRPIFNTLTHGSNGNRATSSCFTAPIVFSQIFAQVNNTVLSGSTLPSHQMEVGSSYAIRTFGSKPSNVRKKRPRIFSLPIKNPAHEVTPDEMPFIHHKVEKFSRPKFKTPRKRASSLYTNLLAELKDQSIKRKPEVFTEVPRVGDSIELEMHVEGLKVNNPSAKTEKVRGLVIAKENKGLGASVHIRDVIYGESVERKIPLHSPLVKSLKVLERNFIYKGKRRVKRAKLFFLRERPDSWCKVTK